MYNNKGAASCVWILGKGASGLRVEMSYSSSSVVAVVVLCCLSAGGERGSSLDGSKGEGRISTNEWSWPRERALLFECTIKLNGLVRLLFGG